MTNLLRKLNINFKKTAMSACLFLAIFAILLYLANFDTQAVFQKKNAGSASFAKTIDLNDPSISDSDRDRLSDNLEYLHGTDPAKTDTDGDGFSDKQEILNGYDPDAPGDTRPKVEISIAKIGVFAPMVWSESEDENDQLVDLQKGVSHFPDSASPGQNGNMVVSGHSSNFVWAKGNFNYIFKNLGKLEAGDFVEIKTSQQNGRAVTFRYKVSEKFVSAPDDERIFENSEKPVLTFSTCWPLGTNLRRLIVKAELDNLK
jgi:LPXTG-site transpeptidase (sortase) family protein